MAQAATPFDPIDLYQWRTREVERALNDAFPANGTDLEVRQMIELWKDAFRRINAAIDLPNAAVAAEICAERRATEPNWQPPAQQIAWIELPTPAEPVGYCKHRWRVPLTDIFTGKIRNGSFAAEVNIQPTDGNIGITNMGSTLATSDDARRVAAALLAAAELKDDIDNRIGATP